MTTSRLSLLVGFVLSFSPVVNLASMADEVSKGPVKVFVLAGQSNMEGKALASTLEPVIADTETRERFKHLKTDGKWTVRDDVCVTFLDKQSKGPSDEIPRYGPLSVGFGGHKLVRNEDGKKVPAPTVGPELGFGWVMGQHYDEHVLLIKAAWGGKSVKRDFRPPSAMPTDDELKQAFEQARKRNPDLSFDELKASYGKYYRKILEETRKVLDNLNEYVPEYNESLGHEVAGFVWFQGWNDGVGQGNPDYPQQLAAMIRDLRKDLDAPNLPVVIGELGVDGPEAEGWIATFRQQQATVAAMTEFTDNVRLAGTAQFWPTKPDLNQQWEEFRAGAAKNSQKPDSDPTKIRERDYFQKNWVQRYAEDLAYTSDRRYHYKGSGACYYLMGEAMAKAMLEMVK